MNLNYWLTFITTVEKGTLSAAAEDLHLTQPAVSKQLQALEDYYGARLLERRGREVRLTAAGEICYRHAKAIARHLEQSRRELAELTRLVKGRLLLGASTTPGQYILPRLIGSFRREYPRVEVVVEIADSQEVIRRLQDGEIDLGVVGVGGRVRSLSYSRLVEDELVLIVPPGHRLAGVKVATPRDLQGEALVWREAGSGTRKVVEERLQKAGFTVDSSQIVMELGSTEAIVSAVEAGLGISLVTCWAVEKSVKLGRLFTVPLQGVNLKRDLYLVRRRQLLSPAAEAFTCFLEKHHLQLPLPVNS
ncbi:LysR family transcriptional regulator [Moorella sp. E308F]|uniref:selenium metabolism-associated LysR family transcriptional regulator n=1 Tax=unclassified Neomoorella TaxID=2676739 RepID=UPI0010FFC137|nr:MULTISPECIES: selenium metabolism-associated LysR family transcriptional regulator [unclassified Moorella (in: firmicutes)]GEA16248.1 LysR family transcriptional regulator [Moorella sp. E308F]GEA18892.1 LysR family transcriptional regulator [Moorella sp. E306M]